MGYLTPNTIPTDTICYSVRVPNNRLNIAAFMGAVSELTKSYNWELFGEQTPQDMADAYAPIYQAMAVNPGRGCMIGSVVALATQALPSGVLLCNGASHLRTDYPDLYAIINSAYITDADNFVVPDLRDTFIYGASAMSEIDDSGGSSSVSLSSANMPAHTHTYSAPVVGVTALGVGVPVPSNAGIIPTITSSAGAGTSFNIINPYIKLAYGIVAL